MFGFGPCIIKGTNCEIGVLVRFRVREIFQVNEKSILFYKIIIFVWNFIIIIFLKVTKN